MGDMLIKLKKFNYTKIDKIKLKARELTLNVGIRGKIWLEMGYLRWLAIVMQFGGENKVIAGFTGILARSQLLAFLNF